MEGLPREVALTGQEHEGVDGLRRGCRVELQNYVSTRSHDGCDDSVGGIDALIFRSVKGHRVDGIRQRPPTCNRQRPVVVITRRYLHIGGRGGRGSGGGRSRGGGGTRRSRSGRFVVSAEQRVDTENNDDDHEQDDDLSNAATQCFGSGSLPLCFETLLAVLSLSIAFFLAHGRKL